MVAVKPKTAGNTVSYLRRLTPFLFACRFALPPLRHLQPTVHSRSLPFGLPGQLAMAIAAKDDSDDDDEEEEEDKGPRGFVGEFRVCWYLSISACLSQSIIVPFSLTAKTL